MLISSPVSIISHTSPAFHTQLPGSTIIRVKGTLLDPHNKVIYLKLMAYHRHRATLRLTLQHRAINGRSKLTSLSKPLFRHPLIPALRAMEAHRRLTSLIHPSLQPQTPVNRPISKRQGGHKHHRKQRIRRKVSIRSVARLPMISRCWTQTQPQRPLVPT